MSNFLSRLADRVLGAEPAIRPRLPALFEPVSSPVAPADEQVVSETPVRRTAAPDRPAITGSRLPVISRADIAPDREMPDVQGEDPLQEPVEVLHEIEPQPRPGRSRPGPVKVLHQIEPQAAPSLAPRILTPATTAAPPPQVTGHVLPRAATAAPPPQVTRPVLAEAKVIRNSTAPPAPAIEEKSPPVINVTIGRIEVRAIHRLDPPRMPPPSPPSPQPRLSLDDYLAQRRQGRR
jgi:hypothetical protein